MTAKHEVNGKHPEALFAELEACFVSILEIELPELEARLGQADKRLSDIRATCHGGLLVTETLRLKCLGESYE